MLRKYEEQWIKDNDTMLYVGIPILLLAIILIGIMVQMPL
jgi:hypothetical protein